MALKGGREKGVDQGVRSGFCAFMSISGLSQS